MTAAWIAALPFVFLLSFKRKYRRSLPARFWLWRNPPLKKGGVWFHACSFGETRALAPLLQRAGDAARLSVTTQTGFEEGRRLCDEVRYLPFEPLLWGWVRRHALLVVMEAELWYLLFFLAGRRGARTLLINARISDRSYPRYRKFAWFYRRIFAQVDAVYAQSDEDARRLKELGARRVAVTGNIKLASLPEASRAYPKPSDLVITAASTHEGEEAGILRAFFAFRRRHPEASLLLVPRHPERFDKVAALAADHAQKEGAAFCRWSEGRGAAAPVTVVDAMGELVNLYAVSDIVVLGGAFVPVGGHNPAEVIPFGCRLVTGRHIFNQRAMFASVEGARFCDLAGLEEALEAALEDTPLRLKHPVSLAPILEEIDRVVS